MTAYSNLSKEQLIAELKRLKKGKKFGLLWEDKPEDVAELCKTKLPVLVDVEDKEIKDDSHGPVNILIEGDNYHALSVLNYTHKDKIDVIYIDPPYNTGAQDWKYNKKGKNLFGGIVTNTDPRNFTGRWVYFNKDAKALTSSFDNWENLAL